MPKKKHQPANPNRKGKGRNKGSKAVVRRHAASQRNGARKGPNRKRK